MFSTNVGASAPTATNNIPVGASAPTNQQPPAPLLFEEQSDLHLRVALHMQYHWSLRVFPAPMQDAIRLAIQKEQEERIR